MGLCIRIVFANWSNKWNIGSDICWMHGVSCLAVYGDLSLIV